MRVQSVTRGCSLAVGAGLAAALIAGIAQAAAATKDDKLAAMVPADLRSRGSIVVATEPFFPPFQFAGADNETLVGLDIDLGNALGKVLGIKVKFVAAKLDAIIPGIQAKRYDISIDALSDTAERRKQVDFIDYFQSGSALFVPGPNTENIRELGNLCGHQVGVVKGTFQVEDAETQEAKCAAAGDKKLDVRVFPDQSAMILAISSGRVDAMLMDSTVGNHLAQQGQGKFKQVGELTKPKRKGIVVPKDAKELRGALQGAMQKLMDDGTYAAILKKYNQSAGAIPKATVNDSAGGS